ncbi:MAG: Diaminopimelate epimerase [Firmicutes bacterium]|nr:Diaminopimelate epimerase [Bacillota bacterium]
MKFTKMHGLGNDFIIVDLWEECLSVSPQRLAPAICHRHFGVGADGLVLIRHSARADCRMQIFNADGSEAESCGNALRCVAKYVYDAGRARGDMVTIEALAGIYSIEVIPRGQQADRLKVNMGVPLVAPSKVVVDTLQSSYEGLVVNIGVPHLVIFVPSLAGVDYMGEGRQIERHELFPEGVNVDFVEVLRPDLLQLLVWERGAGATLACGTGASAALVAANLLGFSPRAATVALPGGQLHIEWNQDDGCIYMLGPAEKVFSGAYHAVGGR